MQKLQSISIVIDLSIFALLILFFIGFLMYDYSFIGLKEPFIKGADDFKNLIEILPWILFTLLFVDLFIKYKLVEENKSYFLKKYWSDIFLTILIPVLFPLKFFTGTLKIYKYIKFAKSGYKLAQKSDKVFKSKK